MKDWIRILITIAIAIVALWVFSTIAGYLFWGGMAAVIIAVFYFVIRRMIKKRRPAKAPKGELKSKEESDIERLIKEMEQMTGKS